MLAGRERNAERRRQTTLGALPVDHLAYGADVNRVALEDFDERVLQCVASGSVE
jgi:hypothetical protein